jgi:hypothetical protein
MAVLGKLIGAMKTGASGAISVSSGMANIAGKIADTVGKMSNFITGGRREQTYGYTSQYFPMRNKKSNLSKTKSVTRIRSKITPLPGTDSMGVGYNALDEKLSQMFEFMKRTHEQNMTKIEVQNSFAKERANEEANRHRELIGAMQKFTSLTSTGAVIEVESKKPDVGIFEKMLDEINVFKNPKALASLLGLITNPLVLSIGGVLAAAYGLKKVAEYTPNVKIPTPLEAQAALQSGSQADIEGLGGYDYLANIIKNRPEEARKALEDYKTGKIDEIQLNKLGGKARLEESAKQVGLVVPEKVKLADTVVPRPQSRGIRQIQWDQAYGKDYNNDGTKKTTATPLPNETPPKGAEPTPDASKGVPPKSNATPSASPDTPPAPTAIPAPTVTPTPSAPVSAPISSAIQENMNLVAEEDAPTSSYTKPVVSVTGSSETTKSPLMSSSATWRDDEPILDMILQRCRAHV